MLGGGEIRCFPRAYNGQNENVDAGIVMKNFPKNTYAYDAYQAWIAGGGSTRLENERVVNSFKGAGGIVGAIGSVVGLLKPSSTSSTSTTSNNVNGTQITKESTSQHNPSFGQTSGVVGNIVSGIGGLIEARNNMQYEFNDAAYAPNIVVQIKTPLLY